RVAWEAPSRRPPGTPPPVGRAARPLIVETPRADEVNRLAGPGLFPGADHSGMSLLRKNAATPAAVASRRTVTRPNWPLWAGRRVRGARASSSCPASSSTGAGRGAGLRAGWGAAGRGAAGRGGASGWAGLLLGSPGRGWREAAAPAADGERGG